MNQMITEKTQSIIANKMKTASEILRKHKSRENQFVDYTDDSDCIKAMEEYAEQFKNKHQISCAHEWVLGFSNNEFKRMCPKCDLIEKF